MILPAPQPEEVVVQMSHKEVPYQMEEMEEEQVQMKTILKKMKKKRRRRGKWRHDQIERDCGRGGRR